MADSSGKRATHLSSPDGRGGRQGGSRTSSASRRTTPSQPRGTSPSRHGATQAKRASSPRRAAPAPSRAVSSRTAEMTRRASSPNRGRDSGRGRGGSGAGRAVVVLIVLVALVLVGVFVVVPRLRGGGDDSGTSSVAPGQPVTVYIPEGSGGTAIAAILLDAGVIDDEEAFYAEVSRQEADSSMKSGTYDFLTGADVSSVVSRLVLGPNSDAKTVTIAEGLTVSRTAAVVEESLGIPAEDFLEQARASNYVDDYPFLADVQDDSLEGYLFPKKYDFGNVEDLDADTVIRAMLDQYQQEVSGLDFASAEAAIQDAYGITMSDYDIIRLASIVEKEAVTDEDRADVASVFYNRLELGMALQSDATMSYVTGGDVTAEDLQTDSPYNTYLYTGLPPTPICTPGLKSIEAALEPADTSYLYFLIIENGDYSNHTFSETYEEHQEAIAQAQEDQADQG